jgi:hypothetical protein
MPFVVRRTKTAQDFYYGDERAYGIFDAIFALGGLRWKDRLSY